SGAAGVVCGPTFEVAGGEEMGGVVAAAGGEVLPRDGEVVLHAYRVVRKRRLRGFARETMQRLCDEIATTWGRGRPSAVDRPGPGADFLRFGLDLEHQPVDAPDPHLRAGRDRVAAGPAPPHRALDVDRPLGGQFAPGLADQADQALLSVHDPVTRLDRHREGEPVVEDA